MRRAAPRPCSALRPETARRTAPGGCGRSAPRPWTKTSVPAWPAHREAPGTTPLVRARRSAQAPLLADPDHPIRTVDGRRWDVAHRVDLPVTKGALPRRRQTASQESSRPIVRSSTRAAVGRARHRGHQRPALQTGLTTGEELVPPVGEPGRREPQLAGHEVQIFTAQHGFSLLARGEAASLRLLFRHGHLLH